MMLKLVLTYEYFTTKDHKKTENCWLTFDWVLMNLRRNHSKKFEKAACRCVCQDFGNTTIR